MASNLRVNTIVPASGTNVAIGTAGGTITYNANVSGVSTFSTLNATSIVGVTTAGITTAYIGSTLGIATNTVSQPLYVVGNAKITGAVSNNNLAFHAEATSATTLSAGAQTKLAITSESFDLAGCYDASNSRYTPNVAGWYFFRGVCRADISGNLVLHSYFKKNGNTDFAIGNFMNASSVQCATVISGVGFFNGTTDYVEFHVFSASVGNTGSGANVNWSGFLLSPTAF
jgi:hypothetical protein